MDGAQPHLIVLTVVTAYCAYLYAEACEKREGEGKPARYWDGQSVVPEFG